MDTIFVTQESFKHVSDSIQLLLPDSIHMFQTKEVRSWWHLEFKDILSLVGTLIALSISTTALVITSRKNRSDKEKELLKEKERLKKIREHVLAWIKIFYKQIYSDLYLTYIDDIHRAYKVKYQFVESALKEIYKIPAMDLSEALVLNFTGGLNSIYNFYELERLNNDYNTAIKEMKEQVMKVASDLHESEWNIGQHRFEIKRLSKVYIYDKLFSNGEPSLELIDEVINSNIPDDEFEEKSTTELNDSLSKYKSLIKKCNRLKRDLAGSISSLENNLVEMFLQSQILFWFYNKDITHDEFINLYEHKQVTELGKILRNENNGAMDFKVDFVMFEYLRKYKSYDHSE